MKESIFQKFVRIFPVTLEGLAFISLTGLLFYYFGVREDDWILFAVGWGGIIFFSFNLLAVVIGAVWCFFRVEGENRAVEERPLKVRVGELAPTGFIYPRVFFVDLTCRWLSPVAQVEAEGRGEEVISFRRRGTAGEIVREFEIRDLFRIASIRFRHVQKREVEVYPVLHTYTSQFLEAAVDEEGSFVPNRPKRGDRIDIRPYLPGDSPRFIHWKLFARTGELYVRTPEPSANFEREHFIYLISDPYDEKAASTLLYHLQSGMLGQKWVFGADNSNFSARDMGGAIRILAQSGNLPSPSGKFLSSFLSENKFDPNQNRLVIYASAHLELWLPNVREILEKNAGVTLLFITEERERLFSYKRVEEGDENSAGERLIKLKKLFFSLEDSDIITPEHYWRTLHQIGRDGLKIEFIR